MQEWEKQQRDFLQDAAQDELSSWLLKSFEDNDFTLFSPSKGPSEEVMISNAFRDLESDDQDKFRAAVVQAIENWNSSEYDDSTLWHIAYVAAYVRAADAVDPLVNIIDEKQVVRENDEDDFPSEIIAVIAGFSPSEVVDQTFRRWLKDPEFDQLYASQLLIGLSICDPENYPDYLPRYLEIVESNPDDFGRLDIVWTIFADSVGYETIIEHFDELPDPDQKSFLGSLEEHDPETNYQIVSRLEAK